MERGVLPEDSVRAALGHLGMSRIEQLYLADGGTTALPASEMPRLRETLFATFDSAKATYNKHLGIKIPAMSEFEQIGYDMAALSSAYGEMWHEGLEPEFVLAPVLTKPEANDLFRALSEDVTIPNRRLAIGLRDVGMRIPKCFDAYDVTDEEWDTLSSISFNDEPTLTLKDSTERDWTLSAIPTRAEPQYVDLSYKELEDKLVVTPSIAQLVALHCQRMQAGKPMIDDNTSKEGALRGGYWSLASAEYDTMTAPAVYFQNDPGTLRILMISPSVHYAGLGTRSPRWN